MTFARPVLDPGGGVSPPRGSTAYPERVAVRCSRGCGALASVASRRAGLPGVCHQRGHEAVACGGFGLYALGLQGYSLQRLHHSEGLHPNDPLLSSFPYRRYPGMRTQVTARTLIIFLVFYFRIPRAFFRIAGQTTPPRKRSSGSKTSPFHSLWARETASDRIWPS